MTKLLGGLELQVNDFASVIKPEFSIFHSHDIDYTSGESTNVARFAVIGVYELGIMDIFTPFVKAGLGVERVSNQTAQNQTDPFANVGAGTKINFTESLALKLEAMYVGKLAHHNDDNIDHNVIGLIGLTYSFGETEQKSVAKPVVIVGDDDDNDGILNTADKCPSTLAGIKVDTTGCAIDNDIDKDGVVNALDKCSDTLPGATVNNDGCVKSAVLDVLFQNNSFEVEQESHVKIQEVADFLKRHTNYSAKIIGYTDSRGSAKYNQSISEKRANAVKELLIQKGVPAKNLSSLGRGEESPIASNMLKEGRAKNRRVVAEFTIN